MPCYTIRTVSVDFAVADTDILKRGLEAAGYRVSVEGQRIYAYSKTGEQIILANGKAQVQAGSTHLVNEAKRAYASEVVKTAAKRYAFTITKDARNAQHMTLGRRAF